MLIKNFQTRNYYPGRKSFVPEAIVIHIMEGSLSGTDSWFRSPASKVSAHYGVGRTGEVHQYVSEKDTAWHAGRVSNPTWAFIKPSANGFYINPNYYTIGIEHEGNENTEWTNEMYEASSTLIREIAQRWNIPLDRDHVIGHHEIYAPKTCPGHKVDLNKLIALAANIPLPVNIPPVQPAKVFEPGNVSTRVKLNIRKQPNTSTPPISIVGPNVQLSYDGYTEEGESIRGNSKWYFTQEGNWFWSGGTSSINASLVSSVNNNIRVPDNECFAIIEKWEGLKLEAYQDVAGVWTIGYGTIRYEDNSTIKKEDRITKERAKQLLEQEVITKSTKVNAAVSPTQINQHQFDALVSFAYNVGVGGLLTSTLLKLVKADPNDPGIRDAFMMWDKAHVDGQLVPVEGLRNRRKDEADLYFS